MRINSKKIAVIAVSAFLVVAITTGCGNSKGSAADYVDGLLDVAYFADEINDSLDDSMSDKEITSARDICADEEAKFIEAYFNMEEVSDETHEAFKSLAEKLSASASYSVEENGDKVSVKIKPLIVGSDELHDFVDDFSVKKYVEKDESCTEKAFVDGVVKIMEKEADSPDYADEVNVDVTVKKENGKYSISDEDLKKIDAAMFVY